MAFNETAEITRVAAIISTPVPSIQSCTHIFVGKVTFEKEKHSEQRNQNNQATPKEIICRLIRLISTHCKWKWTQRNSETYKTNGLKTTTMQKPCTGRNEELVETHAHWRWFSTKEGRNAESVILDKGYVHTCVRIIILYFFSCNFKHVINNSKNIKRLLTSETTACAWQINYLFAIKYEVSKCL